MTVNLSSYNVQRTGYTPRDWQKDLHAKAKRFTVLVLHRRAGKTIWAINHLIHHAAKNTLKNPQYAYIAPTFAAAKRIAWKALHEGLANIPGVLFNETDLTATLPHNNAKIMLLSGENYNNIRGIYLDGCILDETADMSPMVWEEAVRPTLSDRRGWCVFIGTPKGKNHFKDLYDLAVSGRLKEWYGYMLKASESGLLPASELESARATMSEESYEQEYECSFASGMHGAYYAKEMELARKEGRITKVPHDPTLTVETYWDLGINDVTAIWFAQSQGRYTKFIDYMEVDGLGLEEIVQKIKAKPYTFGEFVLPHDAEVRDLSTGRTRKEKLYSLGCRPLRVVPRVGQKFESISALRSALKDYWFDAEKCARGIECIEAYQKKWNEKLQAYSDTPLHNWASNGCDALQQCAMAGRAYESKYMRASRREYDRESSTFFTSKVEHMAEIAYDVLGFKYK